MSEAKRFLFGYDEELPLQPLFDPVSRDDAAQHISYLSSGPVRVPALLARPVHALNRRAILLQHGGGESKDDGLIKVLMRRWSAAGFVCLAIDAPGHGERSAGEWPPLRRRGFFEYLRSRVQNVIDLRRGIDFLESELGIDPNLIGYWGVSMGGSVGVMLMAVDARVEAACLCLAGARSRRAWPNVDAALADFAAANVDPVALATDIKAGRVLMLNGREDETISREDAERLFDAIPVTKEQRWFKTGHKVTPAMLRASSRFFEEGFRAEAEAASRRYRR
jgi:pimeloyl-ACP methyl ester carboxylesterase